MNDQAILQALLHLANIDILVSEGDGKIINAKPLTEKEFGYESGELRGEVIDVILLAGHSFQSSNKQPTDQGEKRLTVKSGVDAFMGRKKDGTFFPINLHSEKVEIDGGQSVVAYILDISHNKISGEQNDDKNTKSGNSHLGRFDRNTFAGKKTWSDETHRIEKAISHAALPLAFASLDGVLTDLNEAFVKLWGYENREELIGKNVAEFSAKREDAEQIVVALHNNNLWSGEVSARKKDGTIFDVFVSSEILCNKNGDRDCLLGSFIDITKLKETEAINQGISKIVEESLNEIYIFDASTLKFTQVNKGARQNLGYSLEELQYLTPLDIKPEFTKSQLLELAKPLVSGQQKKLLFETTHLRKDGTTYPVEIHLQFSSMGNRPVFVAIALDITKQKETEKLIRNYSTKLEQKVKERTQELLESEALLKEAQKVAKLAYWEWDRLHGAVSGSEGLSQMIFGQESRPVFSLKKFLKHIHPDDVLMIKEWIKTAWSKGKGDFIDFKIVKQSGEEIYLNGMVNYARFDAKGKVKKLFGVVQDITDRKKAEQQLELALKKEKELSELKSRFVSMASHEFRTPLTSILASADLIGIYSERRDFEKQRKHVWRIKSSISNLTSILNDFLSLEKLESGKINCEAEPLDLIEFVEETKEELKLIAAEKQKIHFKHQGSSTVCLDHHLLKNVLINLLSNAIKYSPNGEDVYLTSENENGKLVLKVIDHGIGIPEKDQGRMFSRFFRASNTTAIKGTGLGLTIVKRYIDLMGGTVSFFSVPNQETVFIVEIPVD